MRSKSWLVALTLAVIASPASAATLFSDDVEAGAGGWTATGLWHRVTTGDACAGAHGGTASWYYGSTAFSCTYNSGATNSGTLTMNGTIAVPAGIASAALDFYSYYQTEDTGTARDQRKVQVSVDGGAFTDLVQLSGDAMLAWRNVFVDLTAFAGHTIRLRFSFDTLDADANNYRGWYVDDVRVTTTAPSAGYLRSAPAYSWIDIVNAANDVGIGCDDCQATRSIGFGFMFYGPTYSTVNVSSNGYVTFDGEAWRYSNQDIPNTAAPNAYAAPFWDDLYVAGGTRKVYAATIGSAPNRKFVVTWQTVDFCCSVGSGPLTFQLVLSEADQSIVFQYANVDATTDHNRGLGNSATVGIENQAGTAGVRYAYGEGQPGDPTSLSNGLALAFTPVDSDGDGLPDVWELQYGTDPSSAASPVLTVDVDGDGLNWLQEYQHRTNPFVVDSDGDGVSDGDEVALGTDPAINSGPPATITLSGPGITHGTAYYSFTAGGSLTGTDGFRVYYGPSSGTTGATYPAHFDLTNVAARTGYIDQQWGMQGVPMVYFRIAPFRTVGGREFVGTLSNEHAAFFAEKSTRVDSTAGTITTTTKSSSSGCAAGGADVLGLLLAAAALPLRRLRRRGTPAA